MGSALRFGSAQILFVSTLQERTQQALDAGFKVSQLARAAEVDDAAVSHWKAGRTKSLKAKSALGLATLTGWAAQWWLDGTGPRAPRSQRPGEGSGSVEYLAEIGGKLSRKHLEKLIAAGEMLATHGEMLDISIRILTRDEEPTPAPKRVR